jgi:tetraacyldisaccharide 4'-kinase
MRSRFATWIEQQWVRITLWHVLLIPLSCIFFLLTAFRRFCYKVEILSSYQANVPIIVVGNVTVGGTGKTPFVIWLVGQLKQAGFSPGIISRGYGGSSQNPTEVSKHSSPDTVGDEPVLLAKRTGCPIFVNADRVAAIRTLLEAYPSCDVIVSDDGLQHYRMRRDIELAVVDARRGFGNKMMLPAGPLREPIARLKQVDAVIYNGQVHGVDGFVMTLRPGDLRKVKADNVVAGLDKLEGMPIKAVAGIGNPQRFFQQLSDLKLTFEAHSFPDHHAFAPNDLEFAGDAVVLMTEKDAVKCASFAKENWWYLPVDAIVDITLSDYIIQKLRK